MSKDPLDEYPPAIKERSTERLLRLCGGETAVISISVRVLLGILRCVGPGSRNRFLEQLEALVEIQGTGQPVHIYRPFTTRDGSEACRYCHAPKVSPRHVPEPEGISVGGVWFQRPESGRIALAYEFASDLTKKVIITYYATGRIVYGHDGRYAEIYEALNYLQERVSNGNEKDPPAPPGQYEQVRDGL